jgi:hypothetical protein
MSVTEKLDPSHQIIMAKLGKEAQVLERGSYIKVKSVRSSNPIFTVVRFTIIGS